MNKTRKIKRKITTSFIDAQKNNNRTLPHTKYNTLQYEQKTKIFKKK